MLSDEQYHQIVDQVRSSVSQQLLVNELIDHLCCGIEVKMEQGSGFEQAFQETMNDLCDTNLKEIETHTIYLLTLSNSHPMKKITYLTGFLATSFILLGLVFLTMHWPAGSTILLLGNLFLFISMISILLKKRTASTRLANFRSYAGIASGVLIAVGGMFKIMHWPWANIQMVAGMFLLITLVVPAYFWQLYKSEIAAS